MNKRFKAWISKYALTQGVFSIDAEDCSDVSETMITDTAVSPLGGRYYHRTDWYRTKDAALAQARVMRDRKIASLTKQITKLHRMTFRS